MKAIIDSSVLISAFLTRGGASGSILKAGLDGRFQLCVSDRILAETERRLRNRPKLTKRYGYTEAEVRQYVEDLAAVATVATDLPAIAPVCRDPDDDHVLAAAVAVAADVVVTGDDDLLTLGDYEGVRILTVRRFLELVDAS